MAKTWNWDASAMGTDDWTYWKSLRVTQAREPSLASRFDHKKDDGSYWVWRIELNRTESSWICFPSGRGPFPLSRFGLEMNSIKWSFSLLLHMLSVWLSQAILRWLKTVYSTFQDVDFDGPLLPLFISWCYNHGIKKTAQSLVNTLVLFSWHNRLP